MATALGSICRTGVRKTSERLNVICAPTHERYQGGWSGVNANFYMVRTPQVKDWNPVYAPLPANHILLNSSKGDKQIPADVDFDVVLSANKFGQFSLLAPIAKHLHLPLISLEHTLPVPSWGPKGLASLKQMKGDLNVFISEFSVKEWGWDENDPSVRVVHHGIDTNLFSPSPDVHNYSRGNHLLSVVNDWKNRDFFCGFKLWEQVSKGLPVRVLGDTPGLSKPAASVIELVSEYRRSEIFLNTSLVSPIPTALLEAMACGCAVVSTASCFIPTVIENGKNGFLSNNPAELTHYCNLLLKDPALCRQLGEQARKTILERFSVDKFIEKWDEIFLEAANTPFKG